MGRNYLVLFSSLLLGIAYSDGYGVDVSFPIHHKIDPKSYQVGPHPRIVELFFIGQTISNFYGWLCESIFKERVRIYREGKMENES
jgi:hypothetical protein